ncbi:MAG: hypothetical protein QXL86_02675 [Candidatus Aenigmatarchaeota archaeon]
MRKIFIILIILFILPEISLAGTKWISCCSSGCDKSPGEDISFDGSTYCCTDFGWVSGPCPICTRNNPFITIIPNYQQGTWGQTLTYTVKVENKDSYACGQSTFSLTVTQCPSGAGWSFTCSLASNQLTISPSSSGTTSINVTSSNSAPSGVYTFKVKATNNANTNYYNESFAYYSLDCFCGSWSNQGCGQNGCSSNQMYQTRSCNPPGCDAQTQCVGPSYGSWQNLGCGASCGTAGTCSANQQCQKRSDSYGCAPDEYRCIADASCGTTTTTTTLPSGCPNPNGICEFSFSETQANCQECKTVLKLYIDGSEVTSSTYLYPGQKVSVVVYFNDSRYNSTQGFNVKYEFWIDDTIVWDYTNGCKFCWKSLDQLGCSDRTNKKHWHSLTEEVEAYMENGYGKLTFKATLPTTLTPGRPHKIKVVPVILSFPVTLRAAEAEVRIGDGLYNFVLVVKNIFRRLTGFLILK